MRLLSLLLKKKKVLKVRSTAQENLVQKINIKSLAQKQQSMMTTVLNTNIRSIARKLSMTNIVLNTSIALKLNMEKKAQSTKIIVLNTSMKNQVPNIKAIFLQSMTNDNLFSYFNS